MFWLFVKFWDLYNFQDNSVIMSLSTSGYSDTSTSPSNQSPSSGLKQEPTSNESAGNIQSKTSQESTNENEDGTD